MPQRVAEYNKMWSKPTNITTTTSSPQAEPLSPDTVRLRNPGKRMAQIVRLKPEYVDKYKDAHATVWPEVLKAIKNCNVQDCTCSAQLLTRR